jgi:hypothetical protein
VASEGVTCRRSSGIDTLEYPADFIAVNFHVNEYRDPIMGLGRRDPPPVPLPTTSDTGRSPNDPRNATKEGHGAGPL